MRNPLPAVIAALLLGGCDGEKSQDAEASSIPSAPPTAAAPPTDLTSVSEQPWFVALVGK